MKKLVKIRLINWHYLSNETIDVKNGILLTGPNASGKSTLMDALSFILTAGQTQFNIAANDKSKRDLRGYIKCKLGRDDKEYLRDGDVTGHIALEFFDEKKEEYFVVGAVMDAFGVVSPVKTVFYFHNGQIENSHMISSENIIYSSVEFKKNNPSFEFFLTKKETKRNFRHIFGGINDDYFKLIPKALAFKPISDVKDFIYQNILEEKEIDVSNIKDSIRSYKELESTLNLIKNKITDLGEIQKIYEALNEINERRSYLNYLLKLFDKQDIININEEYVSNISQIEAKRSLKFSEIKSLEEESEEQKDRSMEIYKMLSDNDAYKHEEYIIKEIEKVKKQIEQREGQEQSFLREVSIIKDRINDLRKINNRDIYKDMANLNFTKLDKQEIEATKIKSSDITRRLHSLKGDINQEIGKYNVEKQSVLSEMNKISDALKNSKNKKVNYDSRLISIRNDIAQGLKAIYGYDVSVHFLAELLEITDKKWADTVEIFLNNRRFDMIVEPRYYRSALEVFSRIKNKYNLYSVGLVNTAKLTSFNKFDAKSIASIIQTDNKDARNYVNYIAGKVIMCDSEFDLENYNQSITNDLLIYRGFTVRNLNPHVERPFIGKDVVNEQTMRYSKQALEIKESYLKISSNIEQAQEELAMLEDIDFDSIVPYMDNAYILEQSHERLRGLEKEKSHVKDASVLELEDDYNKIKDSIKTLDAKKISVSQEIGSLNAEIDNANNQISYNKEKIEQIDKELNDLANDSIELKEKAQAEYDNIKQNMSKRVVEDYSSKIREENNNFQTLQDGLLKQQYSYINKYDSNFSVGLREINSYMSELDKLQKSELIKYESKVRVAREEAEMVFREDFLSKLRNNILTAEREIEKINETLASIEFGEDTYEFIFPKSSEYSLFYEMVTSNVEESSTGIFAVDFQEKYDKQLEELFSTLSYDEENSNGAMNKFTDYRTYMDYDIKITNKYGQTLSYSKVFKEKSGGETQVPFYVAIIASFVRVFTKSHTNLNDAIGLVLFDEVFDKMDANRMRGMMSFISSLPLQVLIACPPQRMKILGEFTDTTLVMYRQDNRAFAVSLTKKEIEELSNSDEIMRGEE